MKRANGENGGRVRERKVERHREEDKRESLTMQEDGQGKTGLIELVVKMEGERKVERRFLDKA